jgi:membrane protease YdiL (CAAX protease family)
MRGMYPRITSLFVFKISKIHYINVIKYFSFCLITIIILSFFSTTNELSLNSQSIQNIIFTGVLSIIIAPVFEEIIFRGFLYRIMEKEFKRERERLVVNAMLFACAHIFIFEFIIGAGVPYYIFVLGYFLAKLFEDSKSLVPSIMLHLLNNLLVFIMELKEIL